MGNPNARVKLIEYGSLACPHCRLFEETGTSRWSGLCPHRPRQLRVPELPPQRAGHFGEPAGALRGPGASSSRWRRWCSPPSRSGLIRSRALSDAQRAEIEKMADAQRNIRLGEVAGISADRRALWSDAGTGTAMPFRSERHERLINITKAAQGRGHPRTPTFLINGKVSDAATWEQLEPELRKALGS